MVQVVLHSTASLVAKNCIFGPKTWSVSCNHPPLSFEAVLKTLSRGKWSNQSISVLHGFAIAWRFEVHVHMKVANCSEHSTNYYWTGNQRTWKNKNKTVSLFHFSVILVLGRVIEAETLNWQNYLENMYDHGRDWSWVHLITLSWDWPFAISQVAQLLLVLDDDLEIWNNSQV